MSSDTWDLLAKLFHNMHSSLQEELGIEYDEDCGISLQSYSDLVQNGKKKARCK